MPAARCPYCFTEFDDTEPEVRCARCRTPHHQACFIEHGKCVVLGCSSTTSRTTSGLEVLVRRRLEVQVGPERHRFLVRGGYQFGDPQWLDIVSNPPSLEAARSTRIEIGLAERYHHPGEEVVGAVTLNLQAALQARAVRLVVRTEQTTPASIVPATLLEREAVLAGHPWEGHLRALGLAVRRVLRIEDEEDLIWLAAGVTTWSFRFRLDPLHPVRPQDEPVSVLSELVAYVDVPAGTDIVGRVSLPIVRTKP